MRCFALYEDTADLAQGAGCPEAETRGTRDGTAAKAAQPRSRICGVDPIRHRQSIASMRHAPPAGRPCGASDDARKRVR